MPTLLGQPVKRKEDPRLIQGRAHYVDDIKPEGCLHLAFARSVHAHAAIKAVNVSAAQALPGVVAVYTGQDIKGKLGLIPCAAGVKGLKTPEHPCLAIDNVCYLGEPVAAVVARDRYTARDAADLIEIDYEPLPAVTDPEKALTAPPIHPKLGDNVALV